MKEKLKQTKKMKHTKSKYNNRKKYHQATVHHITIVLHIYKREKKIKRSSQHNHRTIQHHCFHRKKIV
jgi:hypothetical protein